MLEDVALWVDAAVCPSHILEQLGFLNLSIWFPQSHFFLKVLEPDLVPIAPLMTGLIVEIVLPLCHKEAVLSDARLSFPGV